MSHNSPRPDLDPYVLPRYAGEDYSTSAIYEHISEMWRDRGSRSLDGVDPLGDNITRAKFACEAIRAYAKETGVYEGESIFLAISDLMNDLRHLLDYAATDDPDVADGYPTTLPELVAKDVHYQAEIRGEL